MGEWILVSMELLKVQCMLLKREGRMKGDPRYPIPAQVDEWILAFVELLKEHCGIDPDKPLEVQEVSGAGWPLLFIS